MNLNIYQILAIIITTGLFGGIINFFLVEFNGVTPKKFWVSILLGVGASLLVPLFLNTLESDIINSLTSDKSSISEVFIFLGFCLIASISSRAFIQTLTDKILKEAKEANKKVGEIENAFVKQDKRIKEIQEKISFNSIDAKFEMASNEINNALAIYEDTLKMVPEDIHTKIDKAVALSRRNLNTDLEEALQIVDDILTENLINSDDPMIPLYKARCFYNKACFLIKKGNYNNEEVINYLKQCFEIYPRFQNIAINDIDLEILHSDKNFTDLIFNDD